MSTFLRGCFLPFAVGLFSAVLLRATCAIALVNLSRNAALSSTSHFLCSRLTVPRYSSSASVVSGRSHTPQLLWQKMAKRSEGTPYTAAIENMRSGASAFSLAFSCARFGCYLAGFLASGLGCFPIAR